MVPQIEELADEFVAHLHDAAAEYLPAGVSLDDVQWFQVHYQGGECSPLTTTLTNQLFVGANLTLSSALPGCGQEVVP